MSSPASTVPDVPTWGFDPEGPKGDFARLIPKSPLARAAFNEIVRNLYERPNDFSYLRQFIHFELLDVPPLKGSVDGEPQEQVLVRQWCGYYRLNMDIQPKNLNLGWVVGSSRFGFQEDDVDLLLTRKPHQNDVRGRHARFRHNRDTGVLLIHADNWSITINGTLELQNCAFAICEPTGLLFGDLSYTVELTDLDPEVYRRQLVQAYQAERESTSILPAYLTPTPSSSLATSEKGKYHIAPARTGGVSSTVSHALVRSTGASVAMKRMKRHRINSERVEREVTILRSTNHRNICSLVEALGYERMAPFAYGECDEVTLVLSPFAPPLSLRIKHGQEPGWIVNVFKQCFAGLSYLHGMGILHRDIKLDNIGLSTFKPPHIVILDFGAATKAKTSANHLAGTVRYLAPEVLALKKDSQSGRYNYGVDTWALGICLLEIFRESFIQWEEVGESDYSQIRDELNSPSTGRYTDGDDVQRLKKLMVRSIVWNPLKRCSASFGLETLGEEQDLVPRQRTDPPIGGKRRHDS